MQRADDHLLGNRSLARFDVCVIGSGAAGASAAHVLTAAGRSVLILEAGHNPFPELDSPGDIPPPLHSNDELKYTLRDYLEQQSLLEPRTFRESADAEAQVFGDVNLLPKVVGGAFQHSPCTVVRFNAVDFRLRSELESLVGRTPGLRVPGIGSDAAGASFVDWPFTYDDLEPFYCEAEWLHGAQGIANDPFASRRSCGYPMPPGVPMYANLLLVEAARRTMLGGNGLRPHTAAAAIDTRFRDGRPPCIDCGYCNGLRSSSLQARSNQPGCACSPISTAPVSAIRAEWSVAT